MGGRRWRCGHGCARLDRCADDRARPDRCARCDSARARRTRGAVSEGIATAWSENCRSVTALLTAGPPRREGCVGATQPRLEPPALWRLDERIVVPRVA